MNELDAVKSGLLSIMSELDVIVEEIAAGELSVALTDLADLKDSLDAVLRDACMVDVLSDSDRLMMAREGKKEMSKQQRYMGKEYDF